MFTRILSSAAVGAALLGGVLSQPAKANGFDPRHRELITVNGIRIVLDDGTWGLVRASSNKPELVVVVESPVSDKNMRAMFSAVDAVLRENPEVGPYNQTI